MEFERWETRYAIPDYLFGKEPNAFLAAQRSRLPKSGRALAVADGEGRNGVWLAEQGLDVLSIDFSPKAQAKARALADARGVKLTIELADVTRWEWPADAFDVIAVIFTQFTGPGDRRASKTCTRATCWRRRSAISRSSRSRNTRRR